MDCATVREELESYIAGDLAAESSAAIAEHLAGCPACARELAELRSLVDELRAAGQALQPLFVVAGPAHGTPQRAGSWMRRHALAVAAALLLAAALTGALIATVPNIAASVGLPVGSELHALRIQKKNLEQALIVQWHRYMALEEHVSVSGQGRILNAQTPQERFVASHGQIVRVVRDYFAARAAVQLPGAAGDRALALLSRFFAPGSEALARARYEALGLHRQALRKGAPPDLALGALANVRSLSLSADGTHATAFVFPVVETGVWVDAADRPQVQSSDGNSWSLGQGVGDAAGDLTPYNDGLPHELHLMRTPAGTWRITDDLVLDPDFRVASMRAGGAPEALCAAEQSRIERGRAAHYPAPAGAVRAFERLLALVNKRRFSEINALFYDPTGVLPRWSASDFQHPRGTWSLALRSATMPSPLFGWTAAYPDEVMLIVDVAAPQDLFNAGGPGFPMYWTMKHMPDGRWLITGGGTGP